tara:strand:- start:671 stop:853 length:183 start_codon:yes stop_codon:yes gene_type:complete
MKKKKKKITQEYILEEINIANAILEVIDKEHGYNPEVRKMVKRNYFIAEIAPLIEVFKTK